MKVLKYNFHVSTKGNPDLINISDELGAILAKSKLTSGSMNIFVVGSTTLIGE